MDTHQKKLYAFLVGNMRQMETELRAQSIVFDALANKLIKVDDLADALTMARNSTEMLGLISAKYALLHKELDPGDDAHDEGTPPSASIH